MKLNSILKNLLITLILGAWVIVPVSTVTAQEVVKYSCSNQVYSAFSKEYVAAFTKTTGVKVDVKTASSGSSLVSLGRGFSDIASTARKLYRRHED